MLAKQPFLLLLLFICLSVATSAAPGRTKIYIVLFNRDAPPQAKAEFERQVFASGGSVRFRYKHLNGYAVNVTNRFAAALNANPNIRIVQEDRPGTCRQLTRILLPFLSAFPFSLSYGLKTTTRVTTQRSTVCSLPLQARSPQISLWY
ncbi:hypothetical protein BC938DRAFT_479434 [Jimgerdemannia flammicorona]|uniref:Inhibitor I9 domain-containing protein n=1 Tax=Jimgerdemannia flammicorona TaxID=994334 RepID=A0A433QKV8_9FUNG|nr:hypothetical protein BC938DRAFT_479434 [Jimgerdemannia flammicorona]